MVFRFTNNPLFYLIFKDLDRLFGLTEECWETLGRVLRVPQTLKRFSHFCTCADVRLSEAVVSRQADKRGWKRLCDASEAAVTPPAGHRPAAALPCKIGTFNFSKLENIVPMRS